jgi:hypothetical protein
MIVSTNKKHGGIVNEANEPVFFYHRFSKNCIFKEFPHELLNNRKE